MTDENSELPFGSALAIDHGTKRVGFAVADPLRIVTQALEAWHGGGQGEESLFQFIDGMLEERTVAVFVLGMPYNMDGSEGPRAADVRAFGERLGKRYPRIHVTYHDERLSTKAAEELLKEAGKHGAKRKQWKDSMSALVILRDWLETTGS